MIGLHSVSSRQRKPITGPP